jgi:hypothetical protein
MGLSTRRAQGGQVRTPRPLVAVLLAAGLVACWAVVAAEASTAPAARHDDRWFMTAPRVQLGVDIDYYLTPGADVAAEAAADVSYIRGLHANSVSVSFPFYVGGPKSNRVYGTSHTPTPADMALLATDAEQADLYVSFRPLMDQAGMKLPLWRGTWTPPDPAKWFASYERFLRPYAEVAQAEHVPEFIESAELTAIDGSPYWAQVDRYLRHVYHGVLAAADNWAPRPIPRLVNSHGVVQMLDDYHPVDVSYSASVATLTRGWDAFLATQPRGVTLGEVGIAAEDRAYYQPYALSGEGKFNPAVQVHWFEAACNALVNEGLGGLYYWTITSDAAINERPTAEDPSYFADGPGAAAIARCFKRLG